MMMSEDWRDAQRWRFFCEHAQDYWQGRKLMDWMGFDGVMMYGSREGVIDAAMAASSQNGNFAGTEQATSPGLSKT